jgi:hypothetical protein
MTDVFKEKWILLCNSENIYYIKYNKLQDFLIILDKPLGMGFNENDL